MAGRPTEEPFSSQSFSRRTVPHGISDSGITYAQYQEAVKSQARLEPFSPIYSGQPGVRSAARTMLPIPAGSLWTNEVQQHANTALGPDRGQPDRAAVYHPYASSGMQSAPRTSSSSSTQSTSTRITGGSSSGYSQPIPEHATRPGYTTPFNQGPINLAAYGSNLPSSSSSHGRQSNLYPQTLHSSNLPPSSSRYPKLGIERAFSVGPDQVPAGMSSNIGYDYNMSPPSISQELLPHSTAQGGHGASAVFPDAQPPRLVDAYHYPEQASGATAQDDHDIVSTGYPTASVGSHTHQTPYGYGLTQPQPPAQAMGYGVPPSHPQTSIATLTTQAIKKIWKPFSAAIGADYVAQGLANKGLGQDLDTELPDITEVFYRLEQLTFGVGHCPNRSSFISKELPKIFATVVHNQWYSPVFELLEDKLGEFFESMYIPPHIAVGSGVWMTQTASTGIALSGVNWRESHTEHSFLHRIDTQGGAIHRYENDGFRHIIISSLFGRATAPGIVYPQYFAKINPCCVAFHALMTCNEFYFACLDRRRSGVFKLTLEMRELFLTMLLEIEHLIKTVPTFVAFLDAIPEDGHKYYEELQEAQAALVLTLEKEKATMKASEKADADLRAAELKLEQARAVYSSIQKASTKPIHRHNHS